MSEPGAPEAKRGGESGRHLRLKNLAASWAVQEGLSLVASEVSFPHRRFRVDVAACAPVRKVPSRKPLAFLSSVLKTAVVFECKQDRSDLIRDNKRLALLDQRLRSLESRRQRLEALLHLHLPHLANGESLFPEFDSYRLREHQHAGYHKLLREIQLSRRGLFDGTKFDRLLNYKVANLHYLVAEEQLIDTHELPLGWGLLVSRNDHLELRARPTWQSICIEGQLLFLQRIAAKKSVQSE